MKIRNILKICFTFPRFTNNQPTVTLDVGSVKVGAFQKHFENLHDAVPSHHFLIRKVFPQIRNDGNQLGYYS